MTSSGKAASNLSVLGKSSFLKDDFINSGGVIRNCGATLLVNMRDIEIWKEDDGFDGAFLSP